MKAKAPKLSTLKKQPVQKLVNGSWVNGVWVPTPTAPTTTNTGTTYSNPANNGSNGLYGSGTQDSSGFKGMGPRTQSSFAGAGSQVADIGSGLLATGAANTMMNNTANNHGVVDIGKARKAGTMTGAAAGLKIGSTIGLNPAALAATGGLSALAVPIGAGIGALAGNLGAKKKTESANKEAEASYQKEQEDQAAADAKAKKDALYSYNLNNNMSRELTNRYQGYKDGGLIKGKGGPKSDDIKAKVEPRSFVVPAKNSDVAKELKEKILKAPSMKKANLNQPNGKEVKVSNGEYLFTPEESQQLMGMGIDLNKLAPDAKDHLNNYMNCGGKVDGYKNGGPVTPEEKRKEAYVKQYNELKKKADSTNATTADKDYFKKRGAQLQKIISDLDTTKPNSKGTNTDYFSGDKEPYSTKGGNVNMEPQAKADKLGKAPSAKTVIKPKASGTPKTTPFNPDTATNDYIPPPIENVPVTAPEAENLALTSSAQKGALDFVPPPPDAKTDLGNVLSTGLRGITDYALPVAQTYMGLKAIQQAGPRPVDKIDPDYLAAIDKSRGIVNGANNIADRANSDARYGYSAEELAALNMQNNDATSAGRFAARNYSGGSAGNAFNMERTALNDSFGRGLSAKISDRNLRMEKSRYADSRRGYADSKQTELNALLDNKATRSRQLFGDTMNSFQQNQQAGSELVGSGIRNLVSAGRYKDELEANKQRDLKYNNI